MYENKSFFALIPARGGSKGLPGKNVRQLGDKPLIAWSIDAAKQSKYIDNVMVTTDDDKIANVAKKYGAEVPFKRPTDIASDSAKMMDVIMHAFEYAESNNMKCDYLVLIQPTSPFREARHVDEAIEQLFQKSAKVILGVTEVEHSPLICNVLPEDGNMNNFYNVKYQNLNRQDMKKYYRLNGAIYIVEWDFIKENKKWFCEGTYAYVMDRKSSIDINKLEDFLLAQIMLRHLG